MKFINFLGIIVFMVVTGFLMVTCDLIKKKDNPVIETLTETVSLSEQPEPAAIITATTSGGNQDSNQGSNVSRGVSVQQSGTSPLVGTWFPVKGQNIPDNFIEEKLELSENGTGIFEGFMSIRWLAENSRLTLTMPDLELEYDYRITDSTLILTRANGRSVRYSKDSNKAVPMVKILL